ncbi:MAG TPA: hypothetical protein VE956_11395 [Nodularia sp. (in: cyanobacteria)]|nr:hypothetical protein [Nodularia sp. (in: cyanobacteria)]
MFLNAEGRKGNAEERRGTQSFDHLSFPWRSWLLLPKGEEAKAVCASRTLRER